LIDFDEALNFGGWNLTVGMGILNSKKSFNAINQSSKVDSNGGYIKRWIPLLAKLPAEHIHAPWYLTED
jgi:deoxyribodipyrimidine photo-lyase